MTDPVDELLSDAGRRWRSGQADPPQPDRNRWRDDAPRQRRWLPMVAAAAATTIIAGTGFLLVDRPGGTDTTPAVDASVAAGATSADALVVDDGDEAQAIGAVLSEPGEPARFCGPTQNLSGSVDGRPTCGHAIEVTGVDFKTLDRATERNGARWGYARLRGVWRDGVLAVTRQSPAPGPTPLTNDPEEPLPCPRPSGGWRPDTTETDREALREYIYQAHPEQFRELWVAQPDGFTKVDGTPVPTRGVEVLVVEVVKGDIDQARREVQSRYEGNLCVVSRPGLPSLADQARIQDTAGARLMTLMDDQSNGIYASHQEELTLRPEMLVLTRPLYDKLARIGFDHIEPEPWLRPVP